MGKLSYDYFEKVKDAVEQFLSDYHDELNFEMRKETFINWLTDYLFVIDDVTGNASGSYTMLACDAEDYVSDNFDLLYEALSEYGYGIEVLRDGAETMDVIIRCYVLGQVINEAVDNYEEYYYDCTGEELFQN